MNTTNSQKESKALQLFGMAVNYGSIPEQMRVLVCDPEDVEYLSQFRWSLVAQHHKRWLQEQDHRQLGPRTTHGGWVFFPHHLVLARRDSSEDMLQLLTQGVYDPAVLWKLIEPYRASRTKFLNGLRTDVRRANLRVVGGLSKPVDLRSDLVPAIPEVTEPSAEGLVVHTPPPIEPEELVGLPESESNEPTDKEEFWKNLFTSSPKGVEAEVTRPPDSSNGTER